MGTVENPGSNPKLERFRQASNAYYDLFNNGGCNLRKEIKGFFGMRVYRMSRSAVFNAEGITARTEPKMAEYVRTAAKEQGIPITEQE